MNKRIFIFLLFSPFLIFSQIFPDSTCTQNLKGVVKDLKTGNPLPNSKVEICDGVKVLASTMSDNNANFEIDAPCNKRLNVRAYAENHAINSQIVFTTEARKDYVWEVKLFPIREFVYRDLEKLIDVDNIQFVEDNIALTKNDEKILNKVVMILEKYPDTNISINVHSDSKGIEEYNLRLTQERADLIMSYLLNKGISEERLNAVGYGSSHLLNNCIEGADCTEKEHQQNRRTEFVVL